MMVEPDVEEFLEHFGVKGMHWGVRNAAKSVGRGTKRAGLAVGRGAKRTGQFIREHPEFVASAAVSIAAGSIFASKIIRSNRNRKISELASRNRSEMLREIRMLDQFREVKVRAIMNARAKGTISPEHASRLASLRARNYISKFNTAKQKVYGTPLPNKVRSNPIRRLSEFIK